MFTTPRVLQGPHAGGWSWRAHSSHPPLSSDTKCHTPRAPPLVPASARRQPRHWSVTSPARPVIGHSASEHRRLEPFSAGLIVRQVTSSAAEPGPRMRGQESSSVGSYIARTTQHCSHSYGDNTLRWMDTTEKLREQWHRDIPSSDSCTISILPLVPLKKLYFLIRFISKWQRKVS